MKLNNVDIQNDKQIFIKFVVVKITSEPSK